VGWLELAKKNEVIVETMYPGRGLGTAAELETAMDLGVRMAVDISHLYIQKCKGVLSAATEARLLDYDKIAEIHISACDGRGDQHRPLQGNEEWLSWALARMAEGVPTILESYMHRLDKDQRKRQIALVRGENG